MIHALDDIDALDDLDALDNLDRDLSAGWKGRIAVYARLERIRRHMPGIWYGIPYFIYCNTGDTCGYSMK